MRQETFETHLGTYQLTMDIDHATFNRGRPTVAYTFERLTPNQCVLFKNNDYSPSPKWDLLDDESVYDLMSFLTLKDGDTDPEYFKDYTVVQLFFRDVEAAYLNIVIEDLYNQEELENE